MEKTAAPASIVEFFGIEGRYEPARGRLVADNVVDGAEIVFVGVETPTLAHALGQFVPQLLLERIGFEELPAA